MIDGSDTGQRRVNEQHFDAAADVLVEHNVNDGNQTCGLEIRKYVDQLVTKKQRPTLWGDPSIAGRHDQPEGSWEILHVHVEQRAEHVQQADQQHLEEHLK